MRMLMNVDLSLEQNKFIYYDKELSAYFNFLGL